MIREQTSLPSHIAVMFPLSYLDRRRLSMRLVARTPESLRGRAHVGRRRGSEVTTTDRLGCSGRVMRRVRTVSGVPALHLGMIAPTELRRAVHLLVAVLGALDKAVVDGTRMVCGRALGMEASQHRLRDGQSVCRGRNERKVDGAA